MQMAPCGCEAVISWVSVFFKFTASLCTSVGLGLDLLTRQQSGWSFEAVANPFCQGVSVQCDV